MTSFLDLIYKLRMEFKSQNFEVPSTIILKSREDGMRIMAELQTRVPYFLDDASRSYEIVEHPNGEVYCRITVMDIEIHWPAVRLAERSGGYKFI